MTRSGRRRGWRRSAWSRTARTDRWRHGALTDGSTLVLPDATGELSDGVVVQAQLLGRVLGLRVLRVDGTVLLSPARAVRPQAQSRPSAVARDGAAGGELAEAARLLRESDEVLQRRVS